MTDQDVMPALVIRVWPNEYNLDDEESDEVRGNASDPFEANWDGGEIYYHKSTVRELVVALRTTLQVLEDSPPDTFGDNFEARWVKAVESGHALITKYGDVK